MRGRPRLRHQVGAPAALAAWSRRSGRPGPRPCARKFAQDSRSGWQHPGQRGRRSSIAVARHVHSVDERGLLELLSLPGEQRERLVDRPRVRGARASAAGAAPSAHSPRPVSHKAVPAQDPQPGRQVGLQARRGPGRAWPRDHLAYPLAGPGARRPPRESEGGSPRPPIAARAPHGVERLGMTAEASDPRARANARLPCGPGWQKGWRRASCSLPPAVLFWVVAGGADDKRARDVYATTGYHASGGVTVARR